jgi:hypothetical protein
VDMEQTTSATVHGLFIEHLQLAYAWASRSGLRVSESRALRVMERRSGGTEACDAVR